MFLFQVIKVFTLFSKKKKIKNPWPFGLTRQNYSFSEQFNPMNHIFVRGKTTPVNSFTYL